MNWLTLTFVRPGWLLALLPLGLLVWQLWRTPDSGAAAWQRLVDAHLLAHLLVKPAARTWRIGVALFAGGLLAAVLALAGPALEQPSPAAYRRDVLRLLVLDLSPRMTAPLDQVKLKMLSLLKAWPDGQSALLVYGGEPYLVVPPTIDVETIALFVPELASDALPVPGNRPNRALQMASEIFARSTAQQRELVWITADSAGVSLPLVELPGVRLSVLQASGAPDPALAAAASRSGGVWVQLRADDGDVRELLSALASRAGWKAGVGKTGAPGEPGDLGYWLLLPLLPLAALAFRRGILFCWLGLLVAGLMSPRPALAQGSSVAAMLADYQAWRLLEAGQPEAAAARFADSRWRAVAQYRAGQFEQAARGLTSAGDADAHYNRGNALARQGELADALAAYEQALTLRAGDADTLHNRDLVRRLLKPPSGEPKGSGGGAAPSSGKRPQATGPAPPVPGPSEPEKQGPGSEAGRVADQWLRRIPDQPGSLLRRKLLAEQRRRQSGEAARAW